MSRRVLLIAALALVLRVAVTLSLPTRPFSDFRMYFVMAESLADTGGLAGIPSMHPPGYSAVLSAVFLTVRGVDRLLLAKLANCVLGVATVLAAYAVARRFWGEAAGLTAAVLMSVYPRQLLMPSLTASENLFTPLLLAFVWLAAEVWKAEKALPRAALTGAVVGALALTRTAAYYIGVVWVLAAVVGGRKLRDVAREFALLLLVQHAVMLPWAVRNHADIGRFTFLTTSSGMALFTGNNDHATGLWYPGWLDDLEASHPGISRASVVERDDAAKKEVMRWMLGNPIRAVELYVSKLGWIFTEDRDAAEWTTNEAFWRPEATGGPTGGSAADGRQWLVTRRKLVTTVGQVAGWFVLSLGAIGAVVLIGGGRAPAHPRRTVIAASLLGTLAYIPLLSALIAVNGRYRWPVEDLAILAAASLALWCAPVRLGADRRGIGDRGARTAQSEPIPGRRPRHAAMPLRRMSNRYQSASVRGRPCGSLPALE